MSLPRIYLWLAVCLSAISAFGYIPATPSNETLDALAQAGGGITSIDRSSNLTLRWSPSGLLSENVSYQVARSSSTGVSRGALVHFSEETVNSTTFPTVTPWIALISCDTNTTNASMDTDVFSLARSKGALSAVLYSLFSTTCIINREFLGSSVSRDLDVFIPLSKAASLLIETQFKQITAPAQNITSATTTLSGPLTSYDSALLNDTQSVISSSVEAGAPLSPGFLLAVLTASNATNSSSTPSSTNSSNASDTSASPAPSRSPNLASGKFISRTYANVAVLALASYILQILCL